MVYVALCIGVSRSLEDDLTERLYIYLCLKTVTTHAVSRNSYTTYGPIIYLGRLV